MVNETATKQKVVVKPAVKRHKVIDSSFVFCRVFNDTAYISHGNRAYPTCTLCGKSVKS